MEGFIVTAHMAMVFFRYCRRYKISCDEKDRLPIIRRLVTKKKAQYVRDPAALIHNKKVLIVKRKHNDFRSN